MNIVFLDSATLGDTDLSPIGALGELVCYPLTRPDEVVPRLKDAEVCITNKVRMTRDILVKLPKLRLICEAATGTDNIDLDAAAELGIEVKNVAGYSTMSVVQTTIALYMALTERVLDMNGYVRGEYAASGMFTDHSHPFSDLGGMTWGIIGMGAIGKGVAKVAEAMGAKVIYHSTTGSNTAVEGYECAQSLEDLLKRADVVSIHCPLNERTRGLIGAEEFRIMKRTALIINVARGGIIDEEAMVEALSDGTIAGAGLDVFSREPLPEDSPLINNGLTDKQLILTPHIAWTSRQARQRLTEGIARNIREWKQQNIT